MFIVVVALVIYFKVAAPAFSTRDNLVNISQITAPVAIIAIGEVLLLVCGEIDLSVGFIFALSPFLMHYLIDFYGVPVHPGRPDLPADGRRHRAWSTGSSRRAAGAVVHRHARAPGSCSWASC